MSSRRLPGSGGPSDPERNRAGTAGSRPTVDAIARRCGIAKATVSKVLGEHPERYRISGETARRVRQAAEALGYQPGRHRRRHPRRLRAIGLVFAGDLPVSTGHNWELLRAVSREVAARGFHLAYAPVSGPIGEWLQGRANQLLDGLLVVLPLPVELARVDPAALPPAVLINTGPVAGLPEVLPDDRQGAEDLGSHLVALGHRSVALIGITSRIGPNHPCLDHRAAALAGVLARVGGSLADWIRRTPAEVVAGLRGPAAPTALVCYQSCDVLPYWRELVVSGLRIPEDVSLACADDLPVNTQTIPALTGVGFDVAAIAATAVDRVVALIERRAPAAGRILISEQLVVRASTGPAPARPIRARIKARR
ncbi:MAG: LacI family transcriptional regulator [Planctomycetes bacterium]|nr:LacI family transcriptional regulator [Planctomycetota bacterium]